MIICISASSRFRETISGISGILTQLGIKHFLPNMEVEKGKETPNLVFDHFRKIDNSDVILVVNPGGYIGNSVKIEIGYSHGRGKKVVFLEKTNQYELDCLAHDFVSLEQLAEYFSR